MKKRFLSTTLYMAVVAASLAGHGNAKTDATTIVPAETTTVAVAGKSRAEDTTTATAADTADMPEVALVYTEVNLLDTIVGQTGTAFKEKVEELSDGKMKVDIQASGVLSSENDVLDTMLGGGGTIDMSRISAFALTSYGREKSSLLSVPSIFVSHDHLWNSANSDLAPELLLEPHENGSGMRGLFHGEEGFRHFFTKSPVSDIEDLKGMKLRVSNDPIMNGMVEGLGASPTVVSFGELYSALQTGVVDGAEQPIANYKSNVFPEVADSLILNGHTLGAIQVIITDEAWDKLTPAQQGIIVEAGKHASDFSRKISEDAENEVFQQLKDKRCNIVEATDTKPWQEACKDIIESSTAKNKELY